MSFLRRKKRERPDIVEDDMLGCVVTIKSEKEKKDWLKKSDVARVCKLYKQKSNKKKNEINRLKHIKRNAILSSLMQPKRWGRLLKGNSHFESPASRLVYPYDDKDYGSDDESGISSSKNGENKSNIFDKLFSNKSGKSGKSDKSDKLDESFLNKNLSL